MPEKVLATLPIGAEIGFYVLFIIFSVHAIVLAYHWFTFGTSRSLSTTALAIYLSGGAVLLITLSIALRLI